MLEKIFSIEMSWMPLGGWLEKERKYFGTVVGLDLLLGLFEVRQCS